MFLLKQKKEELLLFRFHWRNPLIPDLRFQSFTSEASRLAHSIAGTGEQAPLNWVHVDVLPEAEEDTIDSFEDSIDNETCLAQDVLEVLNYQDADDDKPSVDHSDYYADSRGLPSAATFAPMIERPLWLSDSNPVCIRIPRVISFTQNFHIVQRPP